MADAATPVDGTAEAPPLVPSGGIYEQLREQILDGAFDPETPISQIKLAESLGVSRTPLREALRMLQRDGLIYSEPNRRVRVTALSITDLEELYASRIVLEALALRITLPRATSADLDELDAAIAGMADAAALRDVALWEIPHRQFHGVLRRHAGDRLIRLASELAAHGERYRRVYLTEPIAWSSAALEHSAIVEACRARDDALAAERLARHLARTALTVIASSAPEHDALPVRMAVRLVAGLSDSKEDK
jgi:DNA-binding GntR family transcriptional regulator